MSYDITTKILNARAAADARARNEQADAERGEFLLALDASDRITVTEWEAAFLERFLAQPKNAPMRFSDKQRDAIDLMRAKYRRVK